jgi:very-short-patch-repair endonuclease
MMSKYDEATEAKISAEVAASAQTWLALQRGRLDFAQIGLLKAAESPIEAMLGPHLLVPTYPPHVDVTWESDSRPHIVEISGRSLSRLGPAVLLYSQPRVEAWRPDFMFCLWDMEHEVGRIVVECDGHSYHERTKEQAAHDRSRDRQMLLLGIKVMRFTGSEIYRDAAGCAHQVHEVISSLFYTQKAVANG